MANWDEYRTAFHVAREGTVSGAAAALGVHHATVIRHVDALEDRLGTKLFQRHARGYTTTEAGADLLLVTLTTDDQLAQLENRLRGKGNEVSGELVVTSIPWMAPIVVPAIASFMELHPNLSVRYVTSEKVLRLEYGEAHIALRAGIAPQEPDNVVQKLMVAPIHLYASKGYIDRMGLPDNPTPLAEHSFAAFEVVAARASFYNWLWERVDKSRAVFTSAESEAVSEAIASGIGMGFLVPWVSKSYPDLVSVMGPMDDWQIPFWLVTHVDLHRTSKVQAFTSHLKRVAATWEI